MLILAFASIMRRRGFLTFFANGRWWLTFLAIAVITLMDELTSIYYAPYEAYRFIGFRAIVYIALTSLVIRFISVRYVEAAEILELNNLRGGGAYSVSYLVLGPSASFIAAASLIVDYVLTAAMSTVSAVENGTSFLAMEPQIRYMLKFGVVWGIAVLNILGIRANAKFTFGIFIVGAFVLLNLIVGGVFCVTPESIGNVKEGVRLAIQDVSDAPNFFAGYINVVAGVGSCILAYSGIESVLQTSSLAQSWKDIRKSYLFLALTVGIVTPLIGALVISSTPNIERYETNLIPGFAAIANGRTFGIIVSVVAGLTLMMAVNTAMVASSEMMAIIAERYRFEWLTRVNCCQSFYRIHIGNAILYSVVIMATGGSQMLLAQMYAAGLVASFTIVTFCLLKYKYAKGTKETTYRTSRIGTLLLFIFVLSIFVFIAIERWRGVTIWLIVVALFLFIGARIARSRGPEIPIRRITHTPMDVVFAIVGMEAEEVHLHLSRPKEDAAPGAGDNSIDVSFYSPRLERPGKEAPNRFWITIQDRASLFDMIVGLLETIRYDVPPEKKIHVHFGWPLSSWLDRMSIGIMVYHIIRLPKRFPQFQFHLDYGSEAK